MASYRQKEYHMTKREFYQVVAQVVAISDLNDEMINFATAELAKLDKSNENRKAKETEKASEFNAAATAMVEGMPTGVTMTAVEFGVMNGVSTQKASAVLRRAVELNLVSVEDVKVQGKGKMKGYTRFDANGDENAVTE